MNRSRVEWAANAATIAAVAMIAHQVGIKATRDALFLSSLGVEALPAMIAAAAVFSILAVVLASRVVVKYGPEVVVPTTFLVSAVLLLGEWILWYQNASLGSVLLYLHVAALGSFLVSGFWSMINERFDPRTGKKKIGLIGWGAAIGGLAGGLVAERVAAFSSAITMVPILSLMHVGCALALYFVGGASVSGSRPGPPKSEPKSGFRYIATVPYLRNIALLVALTACSATLIDYVFKSHAYARYGEGDDLMRFFAIFYAAIGVATLIAQSLLSRRILEKFGLSRTVGFLPLITGVGSLAMLAVPGLGMAGIARGGESAVRSSVFRSGYELLYIPISDRQKRAAKPIIDVACDRLGDLLAAALISLLLLLSLTQSAVWILVLAALLAAAAFYISGGLQSFYVDTLKLRLVNRAEELEIGGASGSSAPTSVMNTLRSLNLSRVMRGQSPGAPGLAGDSPKMSRRVGPTVTASKVTSLMEELESGDLGRVKTALAKIEMNPAGAARVIDLLAWDEVSEEAGVALKKAAPALVGQLTDALVDQNRNFALRRRIPRVLSECDSRVAIEGLMVGLEDGRFEVRYQCAGALSMIRSRIHDIGVERQRLISAVLDELAVDPRRWRARRLVDSGHAIEIDERLNRKLDLSLDHIFRLLSLFLDREPIKIALRGLYTDDEQLRGTALEYLESVIPPAIRNKIWPLLEDQRSERAVRTEREALSKLMLSRQSIEQHLGGD